MSRSLNKAILIGNLGADPEVRTTNTGSKVATIPLATSRVWKDGTGVNHEKTQWHRVICWNSPNGKQLADVVEKYAKKGDRVYVEGEIEYRTWQDKEGQTRYSTEINAREIILLGGRAEGEASRPTATPARATGQQQSFDEFPDALEGADDDLPF